MSPEMTANSAENGRIRALAWMLYTVFDISFHPRLVNENGSYPEFSHEYAKSIFDSCESFIAKTIKGFNLLSFSMPKNHSSLRCDGGCVNAVPVAGILHGCTDQAMFGHIDGFAAAWNKFHCTH